MTLAGQTALVTGASRGIGRAIAEGLAADGARVIGTATSEAGAASIQAALEASGGAGRVLDVRDAAACEALVKDLAPLAILVNNAGITRDTLLLRMSEDDWQDVVATDLTAIFRLCRLAVPGMLKARAGRIISIGSVIGSIGNPGQANYAAAKAGLVGFSKALAREIGSRGVTVNVVAPGFIDTDMTRALDESARAAILGQIALRRLGSAEDVAGAVSYLASAAGAYITGQTLHINGGMYMS
jgi:3-oxoacyl-[acyl-carrier protein] reductase